MKKNLFLLFLSAIFFLGVAYAGWRMIPASTFQQSHPPTPVYTWKIPQDIWSGNFWMIVADRKGFFKDAGLQVQLQDVSADYVASITDLVQGKLSLNLISAFDLVDQNLKGADLVGILMTDRSEGAEALVSQASFSTLGDLKGKRIGVEGGSYMDYYLNLIIQTADMTSSDFVKVDAQTEDLADLFYRGEIDAMMTWEPRISEAVARGAHLLFGAASLPGISQNILAMPRSLIEAHHDQVTALIGTWHRTTQWMQENPEETLSLLNQVSFADIGGTYSKDSLKDILKTDVISNLEDNEDAFLFSASQKSLYAQLSSVARFFQRQGRLVTLPDTTSMLEPHFIRELLNS